MIRKFVVTAVIYIILTIFVMVIYFNYFSEPFVDAINAM